MALSLIENLTDVKFCTYILLRQAPKPEPELEKTCSRPKKNYAPQLCSATMLRNYAPQLCAATLILSRASKVKYSMNFKIVKKLHFNKYR